MVIDFNTRALSLAMFHAFGTDQEETAEAALDAACDGLRAFWQPVYNDLLAGRLDWVSYSIGATVYVLTRSIRAGADVTRSVFWETGGGLEPLSHHDFTQFDAAEMPDNVNISFGRI